MKKSILSPLLLGLVCLCAWLVCAQTPAATLNHTDDFEDGTVRGWSGARALPPTNVETGGPDGDGDAFLLLRAQGGGGPGSRLASFNIVDDWVGDFSVAGATSIEVDMMSPVDSSELEMRLVLFGPDSTNNRWTSNVATVVPNDGVWRHYSFPINADDLARVQGNAEFDAMMSDVVRVMFRHDDGTPSSRGTVIAASVGLDNITLSGGASIRGDFDGSGIVDLTDVNLLLSEVKAGTNQQEFDLDANAVVDAADIKEMLTAPDILNSYVGDSNLDGEFGSTDLVNVFQAGEYEDSIGMNSTWETGDWNGDGDFGSGDLVFAFQGGGYEQGPRAAAVPEPSSWIFFGPLLWCSILRAFWRRDNSHAGTN